jgi:putative iron-dependent peroxidase
MSLACQPSILEEPQRHGRVLVLGFDGTASARAAILRLRGAVAGSRAVVGLGLPFVQALGGAIDGLRAFPALAGKGVSFPSTQGAIWLSLGGDDRGEILDRAFAAREALGAAFSLDEEVETFVYGAGRDLTGYEDGTENPKGDAAIAAAIVASRGPGLDGSTFVAVQRYRHDRARFREGSFEARDNVIGRHHVSNQELPDAPVTAHVKRAAQESFDPPAFMLRRSMPWGGVGEHGLYFVAFGESLGRFERVLTRMAGLEDDRVDALLGFTTALSGGYYWCPPVLDGKLDLRAIASWRGDGRAVSP